MFAQKLIATCCIGNANQSTLTNISQGGRAYLPNDSPAPQLWWAVGQLMMQTPHHHPLSGFSGLYEGLWLASSKSKRSVMFFLVYVCVCVFSSCDSDQVPEISSMNPILFVWIFLENLFNLKLNSLTFPPGPQQPQKPCQKHIRYPHFDNAHAILDHQIRTQYLQALCFCDYM